MRCLVRQFGIGRDARPRQGLPWFDWAGVCAPVSRRRTCLPNRTVHGLGVEGELMTARADTEDSFNVSHVQAAEADRAISTMVLAFAGDPHFRWLYPDAQQYLEHFPAVLRSFAGVAFGGDAVWKVAGMAAVAVWLPPGVVPDTDTTLAVFESSVPAEKLTDLMAVFEQMDGAHPQSPHWYLAWIGSDPSCQGHGLGSELLRRCLDIIDTDHLPTFLDTPNPRTVPFYERHGFDVVGEWAAGDCPPVVSMLRPAA